MREHGFVGQPGENDLSRSLKIVFYPFVLALWPVIRNAGDIHIAIGEFQTEASGTDNRFIIDHSLLPNGNHGELLSIRKSGYIRVDTPI